MSVRGWPVHAIFRCMEPGCGWDSEDYMRAQLEAALHSRHYGHRVSGEVGRHVEYEPSRADIERAERRRRNAP